MTLDLIIKIMNKLKHNQNGALENARLRNKIGVLEAMFFVMLSLLLAVLAFGFFIMIHN